MEKHGPRRGQRLQQLCGCQELWERDAVVQEALCRVQLSGFCFCRTCHSL